MTPIPADIRRRHYGPDWDRLAKKMRQAAGRRCQCRGDCGRLHPGGRCHYREGFAVEIPPMFDLPPVVSRLPSLQVAHKNHVSGDNRPQNLIVFCPACHLAHDQEQHKKTAKRRRQEADERRAIDGGQIALFQPRQPTLFE